jgi:predicted CoA-binding protein
MPSLQEAVRTFLSSRRIAIAGVSRDPKQPANLIYRKLKAAGNEIFPVNPNAETVEGDPCYPNLASVPGGLDAVVVVTRADAVLDIVRECKHLGIRRVWMHRSFGQGSVSDEAVRFCHENNILVIDGACPMMFCPPVDFAHRCMRTVLGWFGKMPKPQ